MSQYNESENVIHWYRTPIDVHELAELTKRSDSQGFIQVLAHLVLLIATGSLAYWCYLQQEYVLALITLLIHGACYSFLGWAGAGHELLHRTVFKSKAYNDFFLFLFAFLTWNNYIYFRASHIKHHKATVFDKLDGEVKLPQSIRCSGWFWALVFDVPACYRAIKIVIENSMGQIKGGWGMSLFPDNVSRRRVYRCARLVLFGHVIMASLFIFTGHWPLLLLVTFAPFFADWLNKLLALAQHADMKANVNDFRVNSRTLLLSPFLAFLYWQMNYHVEHHMYPGVPFFNLKKLRYQLEHDLPNPTKGLKRLVCELVFNKESSHQI